MRKFLDGGWIREGRIDVDDVGDVLRDHIMEYAKSFVSLRKPKMCCSRK